MIPESKLLEAMRRAAAEARKWIGATSPNPPVGAAALDADGNLLMTAAHRHAGERHAEAELIETCRAQQSLAKVHTLCVTLEPCNHQGRTPPCTEAIINSGIRHVVIGTRDSNPHVRGGGIEHLQQAGIEAVAGVNEEECKQLIASYAYKVQTGRPWITIKRAFAKDGSMIPPPGQKTFTSPASLRLAHQLRKKADAIIAGSGTILVDDPLFTVRYVPDHPGKRRFLAIIDRRRRVSPAYLADAAGRGLDAAVYDDISLALQDLAAKGACDVLVEAGPLLSQAMFDSHLWCASVTIRRGDPDRIEIDFNPREPIPFATEQFRWEWILPDQAKNI
jgi:diaminohydroxyphosphoribosylaminopyrimidine deaminase/5-amino-6-(5-phosphoribosylamino)uracil reductase